jgi:hypothetical protein
MAKANRTKLGQGGLQEGDTSDTAVRAISGWFGVGGFILFLLALPLYFLGVGPIVPLEDTNAFSVFVAGTQFYQILRSSIADPLIMIGLIVFLAGFHRLSKGKTAIYDWLGNLTLLLGLLVIALELVGDGLQAGAALDTAIKPDPSAVRALMEASFPFYGALGLILSAFFLIGAGIVILGTKVMHTWIGWGAFIVAALSLAIAPSILGGTNIGGFYTASGYAPFVAQGALLIWFFLASLSLLLKQANR